MRAEVMIYIYGAVCVSMIVFNIVYNLLMKRSEPRMEKRCRRIKKKIDSEIENIKSPEGKVSEKHLKYLRRTLSKVKNLMAFHRVYQTDSAQDVQTYLEYMRHIRPAIMYLAVKYEDKEVMQASYFTYFLSCCTSDREASIDTLQDILLDYVKKPNLYCRFNAMNAMYRFAAPEYIVKAVKIQDDGEVFFHEKLLTEGLLTYYGDHDKLIGALLEQFGSFSSHTLLAILNYIRFCSGNYKEQMFKILSDESQDKELRISSVRYFGKYRYEQARQCLLSFVRDKSADKWEYATVAASSLAKYPGADTESALKEALHSSNWYVRFSASQSLSELGVDYSDVIDIVAGNDRYAREMMMYRLELRKLEEAEV